MLTLFLVLTLPVWLHTIIFINTCVIAIYVYFCSYLFWSIFLETRYTWHESRVSSVNTNTIYTLKPTPACQLVHYINTAFHLLPVTSFHLITWSHCMLYLPFTDNSRNCSTKCLSRSFLLWTWAFFCKQNQLYNGHRFTYNFEHHCFNINKTQSRTSKAKCVELTMLIVI